MKKKSCKLKTIVQLNIENTRNERAQLDFKLSLKPQISYFQTIVAKSVRITPLDELIMLSMEAPVCDILIIKRNRYK